MGYHITRCHVLIRKSESLAIDQSRCPLTVVIARARNAITQMMRSSTTLVRFATPIVLLRL